MTSKQTNFNGKHTNAFTSFKCTIRFSLLMHFENLIFFEREKSSLIFVDLRTQCVETKQEGDCIYRREEKKNSEFTFNPMFICNSDKKLVFRRRTRLKESKIEDREWKKNINCMINWDSGYATCYISFRYNKTILFCALVFQSKCSW